jgi:hypothetical protein
MGKRFLWKKFGWAGRFCSSHLYLFEPLALSMEIEEGSGLSW